LADDDVVSGDEWARGREPQKPRESRVELDMMMMMAFGFSFSLYISANSDCEVNSREDLVKKKKKKNFLNIVFFFLSISI
jgi:hypothetical protein